MPSPEQSTDGYSNRTAHKGASISIGRLTRTRRLAAQRRLTHPGRSRGRGPTGPRRASQLRLSQLPLGRSLLPQRSFLLPAKLLLAPWPRRRSEACVHQTMRCMAWQARNSLAGPSSPRRPESRPDPCQWLPHLRSPDVVPSLSRPFLRSGYRVSYFLPVYVAV